VVEPNGAQLASLPKLTPQVDSVFPLEDFRAAFERSEARGKRGKVVFRVAD
jgi:NADPH:quinone reductase-like Zn-dependent oxidoreductase